MAKTLITGVTGFVGENLYPHLAKKFKGNMSLLSRQSTREDLLLYNSDVVQSYDQFWKSSRNYNHYIHLAGKAHDLKKTSDDSEYFEVNYELTKRLYDRFLKDEIAKTFIFISSVKAVADSVKGELSEDQLPEPITVYGKSKLKAEQYILNNLPDEKTVVILRPCMIHGPGNKGNLNLLYSLICRGIPWPLGAYENSRSFLSIDNLCYVIDQILQGKLETGVYNISDDEALSTVELVSLIAEVCGKKSWTWNIPKPLIQTIAKMGNVIPIPINEERLDKLTEDYRVSNRKLKLELGIDKMPVSTREGLIKTLNSFEEK